MAYMLRKTFSALLDWLGPGGRKSKGETIRALRSVLLDVERLLVMRDDPPPTPKPLLEQKEMQIGMR